MPKEFYITKDQEGRRIDRLLRTMWPQIPLGAIMKSLRKGDVRLDAKKVSADTRLAEGQFLQVPWSDDMPLGSMTASTAPTKHYPQLPTIYKDEYLWVVNKDAGLLTQPDTKGGDSLISRALAELNWVRSDFHPSTVQRLDRNTSGAVLIALCGASQRLLSELIRERKISKTYRAVVCGQIPESGEISLPLLKNPQNNTVTVDKEGQNALTKYRRLSFDGKYSAVEIDLITGRSHQARVHMAAVGCPIIGDAKYGDGRGAKRTLLHAYSVAFPDEVKLPQNLRGVTFTAPLPADMEGYFK